jgi:ankyrin repeat protein
MAAPFLPKPDPLVTALCEAAKRDDRKQMALLLQQGANLEGRNADGHTALHCAIASNHIDAVRILLSSGADEKNCSKMPALFLAASFGHLDIAKMLLASGNTKVKQESSSGQPYIVDVAATGNLEGTRFLLENGAKAKATTTSGRPMIVQSVKANDIEMTKLLLEHGAKVKSNDITGASLLSVAINKASPEMFEFLLSRGANPDSKTTSGEYVLADVISKRNLKYARRLLDYKASANVKNIYGQKIIIDVVKDQQIAAGDKVELVRRLLERGASAKSKDMHWDLPVITHAMDKANGEVVSLLLRHGADIKTTMKGGETLLIHAVEGGLYDHMLALLEHDADTEATDQKGRTPLMLALLKTDLKAVRMLRRFGAEVTDAPRGFAQSLGQPDMLEALGLKVPPPSSVPQPRAAELPAHGGLGGPSPGHSYDVRDADLPSDPPPGYDTVDRLKN